MLKGLAIACGCGLACTALAGAAGAQGSALTVRVRPQALATNREPCRIGLQMGFPAEGDPLRAECLAGRAVLPEANVAVETRRERNTGALVYRVANAGAQPGGVILESAPLRKNAGCTVRLRCRWVQGPPSLRFRFVRVGDAAGGGAEQAVTVKGAASVEKAFAVRPHKEGAYRCCFLVEPGAVMELSGFSVLPDDAVNGWSGPALEALKAAGPAAVRWPVAEGLSHYNWYQGVGPLDLRQPSVAAPESAAAFGFGTSEFVGFCRLIHAEPQLRVMVPAEERAGVDLEKTAAGVQLAADWVAYCNAPSNQPLARLRARHGNSDPLRVQRWELFAPEGDVFAGVARAYEEAMRAAGEACGISVANAEAPLAELPDRYVTDVLRRLKAAGVEERDYYAEWYGALSLMNDALSRLRKGAGLVYAPNTPQQLLSRPPSAKSMLTERGQLIALFNRFPARVPLVVDGVPASPQSPVQGVAAWTEDKTALVVYLYQSEAETRSVRVDLTALKRRFAFWAAEQLAADLTARRTGPRVPVVRKQKVGSALSQSVSFECLPASFTRIVFKE